MYQNVLITKIVRDFLLMYFQILIHFDTYFSLIFVITLM